MVLIRDIARVMKERLQSNLRSICVLFDAELRKHEKVIEWVAVLGQKGSIAWGYQIYCGYLTIDDGKSRQYCVFGLSGLYFGLAALCLHRGSHLQ